MTASTGAKKQTMYNRKFLSTVFLKKVNGPRTKENANHTMPTIPANSQSIGVLIENQTGK